MKKLGILFSLLIAVSAFAQDIHFTQFKQTPMLQNPAFTGMFNGWERIGIAHKSQWVSAGTKFQTTSVAADMNFFKSKGENGTHMGVGLQFYNDKGGDSKFGTKQMLMNVNAIVPLGESHALSAAIQVGIGQRSGDLRQLLFANQFNGTELDQTLPNNENNTLVSFVYPDIGFGLNYRFGNHKIGFARDDATDFTVGFSYLHANKPELKYRLGFKELLYAKVGINASFLKDISGSKIGVEILFNQYLQGPHSETMFGGLFRYRLSTGSKTTGLTRDAHLSGGLFYRVSDAISPVIFVDIKGFKLGISYDITLSKLGQVARAGGLEFSLVYTNLDFALFKRRRN